MRFLGVYLLGRLAIFVVLAVLLHLLGLHSFYLLLAALALSVPISVVVLKRPRRALAGDIEQRVERRRTTRQQLRAALRGEDPADPQR